MHRLRTFLLLISAAIAPATAGNLRPAGAGDYLGSGESQLLEEHIYIVQLAEPPAMAYRGGNSGLAATGPTAANVSTPMPRTCSATVGT